MPGLYPAFRLLIQRCLTVDPLNRPRLEELIPFLVGKIKTEADYMNVVEYNGLESDDTLHHIVSGFVLNADTV